MSPTERTELCGLFGFLSLLKKSRASQGAGLMSSMKRAESFWVGDGRGSRNKDDALVLKEDRSIGWMKDGEWEKYDKIAKSIAA
jgi:hypothetical protein